MGKGIDEQLARLQAMLQEMNERALPGAAATADELVQVAVETSVPVDAPDANGDGLPVPVPVPARARDESSLEAVTGVAESLGLGFHLGGAVERIASASTLGRSGVADLREAVWLIERYVDLLHQRPIGADLHASSVRLVRVGNGIERMKQIAVELEAERAREEGHVPGREAIEASEPSPPDDHPPLRHELALMIARWVVIVLAVVAIVFLVTLISDWR